MPYTLTAKFPKQQTVFISLQISSHLLVLKFKQAAKSLPDTWGEQKLKLTEKEHKTIQSLEENFLNDH